MGTSIRDVVVSTEAAGIRAWGRAMGVRRNVHYDYCSVSGVT